MNETTTSPPPSDPLERVRLELKRRSGDILSISRATGMSYDTVLRIKNSEGDPGYTKVRRLAEYLFPKRGRARA